MKIKEIHVYSHILPVVNGPYTMGSTKVSTLDTTLVKLVADNGLTGWGETCPVGPTYQPQHAAGARAALGIATHLIARLRRLRLCGLPSTPSRPRAKAHPRPFPRSWRLASHT